jgi:GAF domain-containing protein
VPEPVGPLEQALESLSSYYFGGKTLQDTLGDVAELALSAVPEAAFIALIVSIERTPVTTFFTDDRAYDLDQVQYAAASGPCLDAFRDREVYIIESTRTEERWPEFASAAVERNVHSTLSLPLTAGGLALGAMNFYSERERSFGDAEVAVAKRFAAPASAMLANAAAYANAMALGDDLRRAMASRATIEQAKGIIMATMRCSPEQAFDVLREQSQQQNRKLREVAAEVVANAARRP